VVGHRWHKGCCSDDARRTIVESHAGVVKSGPEDSNNLTALDSGTEVLSKGVDRAGPERYTVVADAA